MMHDAGMAWHYRENRKNTGLNRTEDDAGSAWNGHGAGRNPVAPRECRKGRTQWK